MAGLKVTKEGMIIASAISDFQFKQLFYNEGYGAAYKPRSISNEQIKQLSHFAKQGVKVRLK